MKRLMALLLLCVASFACAPEGVQSPTEPGANAPTSWPTPWPQTNTTTKVYVLMHIWYKSETSNYPKKGDPVFDWSPWRWGDMLDDPRVTIPGAPWLRQISSGVYPLIGPYDSRNPDVIRWQFRQLKAGGADGAFIPVYSWAPGQEYTFDLFFGTDSAKGVLQIAYEENFEVIIEQCGLMDTLHAEYGEAYKREVYRHLNALAASPFKKAYGYLDGRPMYWIRFPDWMSNRDDFLDSHSVAWMFRNADPYVLEALNQPGRLLNSKALLVSDYNLPGLHDWDKSMSLKNFKESLEFSAARRNLGMRPIASAYAGFDERNGVRPAYVHPGRYGLRNGVNSLKAYIENARVSGADVAAIESGNEFGESSTIEMAINIKPWRDMGQEAGLYLDDNGNVYPHKYLDIVRQFKGMQAWVPPPPPPCSIVDPLILQHGPSWLKDLINCTQ